MADARVGDRRAEVPGSKAAHEVPSFVSCESGTFKAGESARCGVLPLPFADRARAEVHARLDALLAGKPIGAYPAREDFLSLERRITAYLLLDRTLARLGAES